MKLRRHLAVLSFLAHAAAAAEPVAAPGEPVPPMREIGNGIFQIGDVKFDKNARTVTIPATVNMPSGTIEYLLVGANGKTHESLFSTKAEPYHVHLAMLFLGAKAAPAGAGQAAPPTAIDAAYLKKAPPLKGDLVTISVRWTRGKKEMNAPIEDFVTNAAANRPMSRGPFVYNGSEVIDGQFLAQQELSFISVVTDPGALINNPRPGHEDDEAWLINAKKVPAQKTPVEITIKLESIPKPDSNPS